MSFFASIYMKGFLKQHHFSIRPNTYQHKSAHTYRHMTEYTHQQNSAHISAQIRAYIPTYDRTYAPHKTKHTSLSKSLQHSTVDPPNRRTENLRIAPIRRELSRRIVLFSREIKRIFFAVLIISQTKSLPEREGIILYQVLRLSSTVALLFLFALFSYSL